MTDPTNLPAARPRKVLTQIAPVTWEHAADRAALQTLRSVPGFDEVVKKIYGFLGERGIRLIFQADAVRVGPTQFPLDHVHNVQRARTRACDLDRFLNRGCAEFGPVCCYQQFFESRCRTYLFGHIWFLL